MSWLSRGWSWATSASGLATLTGQYWLLPYLQRRKASQASKAVDPLTGVPDYVATGSAIPMVFGTVRTSLFVAQRAQVSVTTSSGTVQTLNEATEFKTYGLVLGICQGVITGILRLWVDRVQVQVSTATSPAVGFSLQLGSLTQDGISNRKLYRLQVPAVPGLWGQVFGGSDPGAGTITFTLERTPTAVLHAKYTAWDAGSGTYSGASGYIPFSATWAQVTVAAADLITPGVDFQIVVEYVTAAPPDVYLQEEGLVIDASSSRSFLPDFEGATTITISGTWDYGVGMGGYTFDGTYTVASVSDKRIALTSPNSVRTGWPTTAGLRRYVCWDATPPGPWYVENLKIGLELHYPGLAHLRANPLDHKALYDALKVTVPGGALAAISDAATQTQGWEAEVQGSITGAGPEGLDAVPADVISDLLTSSLFYGAGLDASRFDLVHGPDGLEASGFTRACEQRGFSISMLLSGQRTIADVIEEITRACDAILVDSGGVLKAYPLGERPVGTYAPANRPVYELGYWDFCPQREGDDPVQVSISQDSSAYNVVPVEFTDREASYSKQVADVPEAADVAERGERVASPASLPCIMRREHAEEISQVMGMRIVNGRAVFSFRVAWNRGVLLEPGDVLTISDTKFGLVALGVRVTSSAETPDGAYTITAERYLGELGTTVYAAA